MPIEPWVVNQINSESAIKKMEEKLNTVKKEEIKQLIKEMFVTGEISIGLELNDETIDLNINIDGKEVRTSQIFIGGLINNY